MVKFGIHLEAFLNENQGSNLYIVPYCKVRDDFIELPKSQSDESSSSHDDAIIKDRFVEEWHTCFNQAKNDFDQAMTTLWEQVFEGIAGNDEQEDASIRGATPDKAFGMYVLTAGPEKTQELLARVNSIYETSLTNAEALRKLVKKFDKQHKERLSLKLLPKVYASNFIVGQPTLEDGLSMLRQALGADYDFDEDEPQPQHHQTSSKIHFERDRRGQQHDAAVERRKEELTWLKKLVASIAPDEISHIVAHRGFHNPMDRSDRRPLENSLQAYEAAWTSGIHLCECDIALTKDEKLVLAHDADFSRLALDKDSAMYNCQVRDLTFRELISLPLKSGIRPPLLIDVLRSARAIGGDSQLIIEIKPGNNDAAKAVARFFIRHPDLMAQCAVIMSFDAFAMHTLRNDLAVLLLEQASGGGGQGVPAGLRPAHRSTMSLGNMTLLVEPAIDGFVPLGQHRDSFDHFGVGLSLSHCNLASKADGSTSPPTTTTRSDVPPLPPSSGASPSAVPSTTMSSPKGVRTSPSNGSTRKLAHFAETHWKIPKLMLLTVSDKPKIPCELQVGVSELSKVDQWLHRQDGSLDGVYLQFQKEMLHAEGTANLRALAAKYSVGVWGYSHKDPDDYQTFHHLVREDMVSFVNSDLPKGFKKKGFFGLRGVKF